MPTRMIKIRVQPKAQPQPRSRTKTKGQDEYEHILSDLGADKIPPEDICKPLPEHKAAVNRALTAMNTLRQLGETCSMLHNIMDPRVLNYWRDVWEWMKYFEQHSIIQHEYPIALEELAATEIALFGLLIILDKETRRAAILTPGYVEFVTRLWLQEEEHCQKYHRIKSAQGGHPFSLLLAKLLTGDNGLGGTDTVVVARIVQGAGSVDEVAAHTVKSLLAAVDASPRPNLLQSGNMLLLIVSFYTHWHMDTFFWALMREGVTTAVTKTFCACVDRLSSAKNDVIATMSICCSIFSVMHLTHIGPSWVAQAIEAGMLRAMLLSGAFMKAKIGQACVDRAVILFSRMGHYLTCRSVLRALKQPLRELLDSDIDATVAGPLWKIWLVFRYEAKERLLLLKQYDAQKHSKLTKVCGYTRCPVRYKLEDDTKAMRCSGCFSVYYCSKTCQKKAWPDHRLLCVQLQAKSSGPDTNPITAQADYRFFQYLNEYNLHSHMDEIIDMMLGRKSASVDISDVSSFVVGFDYQQFPMMISLGKASLFESECPGEPTTEMMRIHIQTIENNGETIREAKESVGQKISVQTRSPVMGSYWPEVEVFAIDIPSEFEERFNKKLEEKSRSGKKVTFYS